MGDNQSPHDQIDTGSQRVATRRVPQEPSTGDAVDGLPDITAISTHPLPQPDETLSDWYETLTDRQQRSIPDKTRLTREAIKDRYVQTVTETPTWHFFFVPVLYSRTGFAWHKPTQSGYKFPAIPDDSHPLVAFIRSLTDDNP